MNGTLIVHRVVKSCKRAGQYIDPHTHPFFHYIYILSGHIRVMVDGEQVFARPGSLVLIPPGTVHAITSEDTSVCLDLKFTCSGGMEAQAGALPRCIGQVGGQANGLIRSIFDEAVGQAWGYEEIICLRLRELLLLLLRRERGGEPWQMGERPAPPGEDAHICRALRLIEERLEMPLRVSELAKLCGYSENYFRLFFKEHVGVAPNSYINQRKIARAKELMLYSDLSVTQIAERLGYQSIHYFSRLFKKMTGLTPTGYIDRVKKDCPINIVHNENTPAGEFELPVRDPLE